MARRTKLASWLGILAILTHPCGLMGAIEILNPLDGQNMAHNSSIGCLGNTNMGQDVLVKLIINGSEYDQATIAVPPAGF